MWIRSDAYVDQTPRFAGRGRFLARCARLGLIQSICSFHRTRDQARTRVRSRIARARLTRLIQFHAPPRSSVLMCARYYNYISIYV